jgi:hypothetical protein
VQLIQSMDKKKQTQIELTEMFMAKADPTRCFFGIIKRFEDHRGNPLVFSKIVMPEDGYICAQSTDQKELGKTLDKICIMVLDQNINADLGVKIKIFGTDLFLN